MQDQLTGTLYNAGRNFNKRRYVTCKPGTVGVTIEKISNPVVYFIRESKLSHLVHEGCMTHSVKCFGFVTAVTSLNRGQPNFAQCLADSCTGTLYIHFFRFLPPDGTLPGAKFTLRLSLVFSYIGIITAWHSSSGRQPNFAALRRGRHLYSARWPSRCASAHILVVFTSASCGFRY